MLWASDAVVIFFVHAVHTLLAYGLLQSNITYLYFAYLSKYQALSLLTLVFSASLYAIFVRHDFLPVSFQITFWIALTSHSVTSCSLHKKKNAASVTAFQKCYFFFATDYFWFLKQSLLWVFCPRFLSLPKDFGPQHWLVGLKWVRDLCFSFLSLGFLDRYFYIYTHTLACVYIGIYTMYFLYIVYLCNVSNMFFFWAARYTSHFHIQFLSDISKGELNENH